MKNNKIKSFLLALTLAFPVLAYSTANPVSGRIGTQSLTERGLTDAADGRFDEADDNLAAALKADPSDSKAAEGLLALRISRGEVEGGREPAMALLKYGSPRQAVAAAEFLAPLGYDALSDMFLRQDVLDNQASAEWLAAKLVAQSRWADARRVAVLSIGKYPRSWRLSVSHATALGMIDSAESAEAALREAKENGAPQEALAAASRVVSSASARKKLSDEMVKKSEAEAPIKKREPVREAVQEQPRPAPTTVAETPPAVAAPIPMAQVKAKPLPAPSIPSPTDRFNRASDSLDGDVLFSN